MTGVVAVVGGASPAVADVGKALGELLHAGLLEIGPRDVLHASDAEVAAVLAELTRPDVRVAVLPDGAAMSGLSGQVLGHADRPVVVAPAAVTSRPRIVSRVLLPLDGSRQAAAAVAPTAALLADAGVDLVVLHVFDEDTVPLFWDQAAHARQSWEPEFLARYCALPGVRLRLRSGAPGEEVLDVAAEEGVDLIALGWSQRLEEDRAATARRTLREASVPVLLVPVAPATAAVRL